MRPLQTSALPGRKLPIACMGDSLTDAMTYNVTGARQWPGRLAYRLNLLGADVGAVNAGKNGNTTAQMLARFLVRMYEQGTPELGIIFGGVNDPGAAIASADTTRNARAMVKILKNRADGYVTGQASLPAGQPQGTRYVVTSDTSATGGLAPTGASPATLAGAVTDTTVWISRNGLAGEAGWSRVADVTPWVTPRIMLVTPHFLNFTAGGDTADPGGTHSGQGATYKAVNDAIVAAATAESVPYCDLYAWLQDRINDGFDAPNSGAWHLTGVNQHWSAYGHDLAAQAILGTTQAQPSTTGVASKTWVDDLTPEHT